MTWRIPLSDLRMTDAQRVAALEVLDGGWWSMGPRTATFEREYADTAGCRFAAFVSSATSGLLLALKALGVGPGDEVILPSLTFVADANVVSALGAQPVLADIEGPGVPLLDADSVASAVSSRTRAVVVVHYAGHLVDVPALRARLPSNVAIVEDAAHAVGPVDDGGAWAPVFGHCAVHSFFANKNLALGEGGMVLTDDEELDARVRRLRSHGMTATTWDRHSGHAYDYDVLEPGYNLRPLEITAALGSAGLADLGGHNAARRELLRLYRQRSTGTTVSMIFDDDDTTTGHIAVARLAPGGRPAARDRLRDAGIQSSFHYPPIHRFTAYAALAGARRLPRTEEAAATFVTLPLHPWMLATDIDAIMSVLTS